MITLQKYRSLIKQVGNMRREADKAQKEFAALGIETPETDAAFRLIKKIEATLKFRIKEIEVDSDDKALERWAGKEGLK